MSGLDEKGERIVAAALQLDGVTHSLPRPKRHHDVMYALDEAYWQKHMGKERSGFLTSDGRFVNRFEAKDIARHAGQLLKRASKLPELFSEDVW